MISKEVSQPGSELGIVAVQNLAEAHEARSRGLLPAFDFAQFDSLICAREWMREGFEQANEEQCKAAGLVQEGKNFGTPLIPPERRHCWHSGIADYDYCCFCGTHTLRDVGRIAPANPEHGPYHKENRSIDRARDLFPCPARINTDVNSNAAQG